MGNHGAVADEGNTGQKVRRVVVADDDSDIVDILTFNLEAAGYSVLSASDGEAARDEASHGDPLLGVPGGCGRHAGGVHEAGADTTQTGVPERSEGEVLCVREAGQPRSGEHAAGHDDHRRPVHVEQRRHPRHAGPDGDDAGDGHRRRRDAPRADDSGGDPRPGRVGRGGLQRVL